MDMHALSSGGGRVLGVTIVLDGNLDETFSGSAATGDLTIQSGNAGKLYDAVLLQVTADSTNVPENGSAALHAVDINDDGTRNERTAGWGVLYGPLSLVDSNGMAFGATVYQDELAQVQAVGGGLTGVVSLTVLDILKDNAGLYGSDGIADAWQVQYFGVNNTNAAAAVDDDRDGQSNFNEFMAGTSPVDETDFFGIRRMSRGAGGVMEFVMAPMFSNRTYTIEATTNLVTPRWVAIDSITTGVASVMAMTGETNRVMYYRAGVYYAWQ